MMLDSCSQGSDPLCYSHVEAKEVNLHGLVMNDTLMGTYAKPIQEAATIGLKGEN